MKRAFFLLIVILFSTIQGRSQATVPLTLVQTIELPDVPSFMYAGDIAFDLKSHRLFASMQGAKSVVIVDTDTGKLLQSISVEYAHTVVYLNDLSQLYVTDQGASQPGLRIFDGHDYHLIKLIKLQARADAADYDSESKLFYVDNGGAAAKQDYSLITIIDTNKGEVVGEIKIPTKTLEGLVIERSTPRIYVNLRDDDKVAVLDRQKRVFLESWTITKGHGPSAIALDEKNHRLFVACRTRDLHGHIVVFDTGTGKELDALPIGGHVDSLTFDETSRRLYATCGSGEIDVYQQHDADHYSLLGKAETGIMARSGLLVPEFQRFFATVPHIGTQTAKILVFKTQ